MNTSRKVPVPNGVSVMRVRFRVPHLKADGKRDTDYRPMKWPIPHPYWCTGSSDEDNVLVAYVESPAQLLEFWPDAEDIETLEPACNEYTFTTRFNQPYWLIL